METNLARDRTMWNKIEQRYRTHTFEAGCNRNGKSKIETLDSASGEREMLHVRGANKRDKFPQYIHSYLIQFTGLM